MSIYDNIAYGPRVHGIKKKAELDALVETSLRQAAIWEEVKDDLKKRRAESIWRTAAAFMHRPGVGDETGSSAHG
ncbi:MAG: hypothetical protein ACLR23_22670 [Clostridia bacterium]